MKIRMRSACWLLCAIATACSSGDDDAAQGKGSNAEAVSRAFVINEFAAQGADEWIEIGNHGSASIDLSGFGLADSDKTTGKPRTSEMMVFPAGSVLGAGEHLLVLTNKSKAGVGPYPAAQCLPGATVMCFYASFGVSAKTGESVHLLGPDQAELTSTAYPQAVVLAAAQSACRLPDMTGEFAACVATPGAVNAAP